MAKSSDITLPDITPEDIKALTDSGSFSRGKTYFRNEYIFDAMRQGLTLTAWCEGSSGGPYRVRAELAASKGNAKSNAKQKVAEWDCTCPRGGFCKHVVALLLTWINDPEAFDVIPPLPELLGGKSQAELLALLDELAKNVPGLEREILRLAPPPVVIPPFQPGAGTTQSVDLGAIRRRADRALAPMKTEPLYDHYGEYGNDVDVEAMAADLETVRAIGDRYAEAGRWSDAQAIYTTVAERGMAQFNESIDVDGAVVWVIDACEAALLRVLEAQRDLPEGERLSPHARRSLLETAFQIWRFDFGGEAYASVFSFSDAAGHVDLGAFRQWQAWGDDDEGDDEGSPHFDLAAAITNAATADERTMVEGWLNDLLKPGEPRVSGELRRAAIRLRFDLNVPHPSADVRLEAYKAAGLWADAIVLLVEAGQVRDAIALADRSLPAPHQATSFADYLSRHSDDLARKAIAFIEDRLWETEGKNQRDDEMYQTWLSRAYAQHGMTKQALAAELRRFAKEPSYPTYFAVERAATLPGQEPGLWARTRPELLRTFEEHKNLPALLEAHFSAGEVDEAHAILRRMEQGDGPKGATNLLGWRGTQGWTGIKGYRMKLAPLIADKYPDEAIITYRDAAEEQIEYRQRAAYREAAGYLAEVKEIYARAGRAEEWKRYISALRETFKRLPALQQELDAKNLS